MVLGRLIAAVALVVVVACQAEPAPVEHPAMLVSTHAGWEVVPIFTVGDRIGDYRPPGVLDGTGSVQARRRYGQSPDQPRAGTGPGAPLPAR